MQRSKKYKSLAAVFGFLCAGVAFNANATPDHYTANHGWTCPTAGNNCELCVICMKGTPGPVGTVTARGGAKGTYYPAGTSSVIHIPTGF